MRSCRIAGRREGLSSKGLISDSLVEATSQGMQSPGPRSVGISVPALESSVTRARSSAVRSIPAVQATVWKRCATNLSADDCWSANGIPIDPVAEWLGDDPRTVLKVYAHVLGDQQTIEALRHLNERASGPSQDPRAIPENVVATCETGGTINKTPT